MCIRDSPQSVRPAENIVIRTGEEDFYHILPSAQDISGNYIDFGFLQTNVSAVGTMYKIVDLANFIEACGHREFPAADLTVAFDFYDELAHRCLLYTSRCV